MRIAIIINSDTVIVAVLIQDTIEIEVKLELERDILIVCYYRVTLYNYL